jgi:hypothetical protein
MVKYAFTTTHLRDVMLNSEAHEQICLCFTLHIKQYCIEDMPPNRLLLGDSNRITV